MLPLRERLKIKNTGLAKLLDNNNNKKKIKKNYLL